MTPPLRPIHTHESLRPSSVEHWSGKETAEIVASLGPDVAAPLLVAADGTVMDGNTRVLIVKERSYEVDSLPRKPYPP